MLDKYKKIFITGTDTNVGKTYYSVKLLREFNAKGFSTIGVKPISTGYDTKSKINDDAKKLYDASSIKIPINEVNPFSFKEPISPNIAAKKENVDLSVEKIIQELNKLDKYNSDIQIIEGVGGWDVPINSNENMSDLVKKLNIPVILVISIKLGCLNHAILTSKAIMNDNVTAIGWIANRISKDEFEINENINTLKSKLKFKLLDII
ncbi:dethiobiotin synthase [Rickettsiales endosymbiont of Trichoplax sp. H2]|uniref:dethiobiotin synthase n=1 Tax=Rickettsiales endosymbiont of Trichoplax sp. H2 TaxID=2021221 RepID=UPI0012B41887|nr:dethiobiotin synthase [Rickettsiales endosymbiont of Trichoplax sp. H2]MSO13771.1 ATP-dependent dethiobiotin synthetase BioD [Rickettsiales endosymbiont of Trichoplax sp. H2]